MTNSITDLVKKEKAEKKEKKLYQANIDADLYEKITEICITKGITRTEFLEALCREFLSCLKIREVSDAKTNDFVKNRNKNKCG